LKIALITQINSTQYSSKKKDRNFATRRSMRLQTNYRRRDSE
jgi:hypothetical protein